MRDMRIFIAVATFFPLVGGAERQALEQGRSLRRRGLEATIVTFRHDKSWPVRDAIDGVPVVRVAGALLGGRERLPRILQRVFYFLALIVMAWTLWWYRSRYDVLHVYQLSLFALPTALACYMGRKPMVVLVCGADAGRKEESQGQVSLIAGPLDANDPMLQVYGRSRTGGDLHSLERLGKPVVRFAGSLLQRIRVRVIISSTRMREYFVAHDFGLSDLLLIPSGVDTTRFAPRSEDASDNQCSQTVVCVARLSYEKGIDVLLQAWNLVCKELPTARLIIAGVGPIQAQLTYLANALDLGESVNFVGLQSDVVSVLHQGSIATLPSRSEGMPNAILEAMACGLPCVATRVSGTEDVITHGVDGLLVEPEDYESMAQALLSMLRDPARVHVYGKAARATIERSYALEYITGVYVDLYQQMADEGKSVPLRESVESGPLAEV